MFGDRARCGAFEEFKSIWDPDWKMNPGKVVQPYRVDENLRLGADYEPWRPKVKFGYPQRPRRLRARDRPLRRRRQVPHAGRRRRDVPVLHGDARGDALDARPHAAPVRDARRRGHHRRLAVGRGDGGARPLPRVQGLHERLPGRRRHAHLQGGVPPPPLEAPAPPAPRVRVRADRPGLAASRRARPGVVNFVTPDAAVRAGVQARRRDDAGARGAEVRAAHAAAVVRAARRDDEPDRPQGRPLPGHVQQPHAHRRRRRRGRGARGGGLAGRHARGTRLLRAAALRLRLPRPGRALPPPQPRPAARVVPRGHPDRRARAELRRRLQGRARQAPAARRRREAARRRARTTSPSSSSSSTSSRRGSSARRSSGATATTRRPAASTRRSSC